MVTKNLETTCLVYFVTESVTTGQAWLGLQAISLQLSQIF